MNRSWYTNTTDFSSPDAIHQILAFGTIGEIEFLKKTLGEGKVRELFLRYPKKVYTRGSLNFIKKFILRISNSVDEQKYLKSSPRSIR